MHGLPLPKRKCDRKVSDVRARADEAKLFGLPRFRLDDLLEEYEHAVGRCNKFSRMVVRTVSANGDMIRVMQSPGVGVVTAFAPVAFVEDVRRFAAANKSVTYAWHILMGHPAPSWENERMYRAKVRGLACELGKDVLKEMGFDTAKSFVEHHVAPLYAHLPAAELKTAAK